MGNDDPPVDKLHTTQIGLHAIRNVLGEQNQTALFDNHDVRFAEEYGIELSGSISRFGVDLTDMEVRVMEGILHGFTRTSYKGNLTPHSRDEIAEERYSGKVPKPYKYVKELPRLRVKQSEILEWAGINRNSIAAWGRALSALKSLGTKQFCFYYDRLEYDEHGKPLKDRDGGWKKEQVDCVDTLFLIKEVRDKSSGRLKYYEITPSPLFLDQRESYFMLVPYNWREEVRALYGNKKASGYLFQFLIFLRTQYELKRRSKRVSPPYQIRWSPEEIARALNMPEGTIKKRKHRMFSSLQDCYSVALKLGYLSSYEEEGHVHLLTLNDEKYFGSSEFKLSEAISRMPRRERLHHRDAAIDLFFHFHSCRRTFDPSHNDPVGGRRVKEEEALMQLLEKRGVDDIRAVIDWSTQRKYWCSRLSTVAKLVSYFDEAFPEMMLDRKATSAPIDNRAYAEAIVSRCGRQFDHGSIEVLNKHIEFCTNGVGQPICIAYDDKRFREKLAVVLRRWGINDEES